MDKILIGLFIFMIDLATIGFKSDVSGLKNAEKSLDSLAKKGEHSEKRINKSVSNTNKSFNTLKATIGAAGAALTGLGAARLTSEITKQSDAWKNINSQIRQVTESEEALLDVREKLLTLSKDTRSDLTNTVDLYAQLTRSTKDLGTSQGEILSITKTLNNLFVAGGKPISEVSGAIRQLSQGFAAGALRGDEFNSVAEGAPKIMDALASKLKMTRGELREFAATGGITAEIMVNALKDYKQVAQKLADQTTKTFGQSIENATTNITKFVGEAKILNDAVDTVGSGIESLTGELGNFSREIALWGGQWGAWSDDAQNAITGTNDVFRKEFMALGAITDETMKFMGGAIINFPSNIRAMTKILAVELGFAIDMIAQHSKLIINAIKSPFVTIPTIVEAYIKAFGNVLGTRLAEIVEKVKIYGLEIKDALNPFDGDTFDFDAAIKNAENISKAMTNEYLQAAEEQILIAETARDEESAAAKESAEARILASKNARQSTIADILAERDATLSVYKKIESQAKITTAKVSKSIKSESKSFLKITEGMIKRIDKAFSDVWLNIINGSGNVFDSVIDGFKRMLAEMIHLAVTKPIVLQIGTALGLGGISSAANAGGILGGLGGLGGAFSSGFGGTNALLGAGSLSGAFSNIGSLFGGGEIAAGIGASLPIAAIAAAAAGIVDKITGGGLFGTSYKEKDRTLNLGFGSEGAFGSTLLKEQKKRSLFRGTKTRLTENDLDLSVIGDMFQSVQDSILDAAKLLDITTVTQTTTNFIRDFETDFKRSFETVTTTTETSVEDFINNFSSSFSKSIKGMSEEEIQAEISNWANKTTEQMVTAVFGGLAEEFAKESESSIQTIDRLIMNMQAFNQVTDTLGLDFGLIGEAAAKAATNVVEMVGGLDSLNQLTTQYFNSFYDQSEQFDFLTSSLNASFEELGQTMPATRDQFRALVDGLDLTTEAGQEMFAALMQLVPGMDAFFDSMENEYTNALNSAMSALKESVALEKDRAKEILNNARLAYDAEVSRINTQRDAVLAQESSAQQGLDLAKNALDASFEAQRNAIQDATNERISGLNAEISLLSGRKSSLSSVANDMRSLSQSLANAAGLVNDDIGAALASARRGDFSAAKGLSGQLPSASGFSSATEFKAAQALAKNQLAQISGLAGTRATDAERQIAVLEGISGYLSHQISQAQADNQEQLKALDDQYNSILGIDNTVLSLNDAITQYQEAQLQLDSLQTDSMLEALDNELAAANALLELAQQTYDDEISRLDDVILNAQAQLDALYGIDTSIMSVTDAINNLNDIIANPPEPTTTTEPVVDPAKKELDDNILAQNEEIRQNTKITNRLLQQMIGGGLDVRVEP